MQDKERIKTMTAEEAEKKTIELLNSGQKAQYFYAGVSAAMKSLSIRPEEFADECRANA